MTFHEEAAFTKSKGLQQESEAVQPASPSSENEESYDQRDEARGRLRLDALLPRIGSVAKTGRDISGTRIIHSGCIKEVWYDGLQIHVYSDGYQTEEAT